MSAYFDPLVDFVGAHPQLSFLAVFLLALSEAVPVVGTVVPGPRSSSQSVRSRRRPVSILGRCSLLRCSEQLPAMVSRFGSVITISGSPQRLAAESLSLADRAQRPFYPQIWDHERVPGALHSASARLCTLAGRRTENVIQSFLCGQYPIGTGMGADARVSWSVLGLAITLGGAHAPELSLAAVGALILAWITWSMIRRKAAAVLKRGASQQVPESNACKSTSRATFPADSPGQSDL